MTNDTKLAPVCVTIALNDETESPPRNTILIFTIKVDPVSLHPTPVPISSLVQSLVPG